MKTDGKVGWLRPAILLLAITTSLGCVSYVAYSKTIDQILKYSSFIAASIAVFLIIIFVLLRLGLASGPDSRPLERPALLLIQVTFTIFLASLPTAAVIYSVAATAIDIFHYFQGTVEARLLSTLFLPIAVLLIASLLFYTRLRYRCIYGATEVVVGIFIANYQILTQWKTLDLSSPGIYLSLLTAGIYLIVRGLDNMHQGLSKDPIDALGKFIIYYGGI